MTDPILISATEFILPYGRKEKRQAWVSGECSREYASMIESMCEIQAEVLSTDEVSVTIFSNEMEEDVDIRVVPNGPEVIRAIEEMLKAKKWLECC